MFIKCRERRHDIYHQNAECSFTNESMLSLYAGLLQCCDSVHVITFGLDTKNTFVGRVSA